MLVGEDMIVWDKTVIPVGVSLNCTVGMAPVWMLRPVQMTSTVTKRLAGTWVLAVEWRATKMVMSASARIDKVIFFIFGCLGCKYGGLAATGTQCGEFSGFSLYLVHEPSFSCFAADGRDQARGRADLS